MTKENKKARDSRTSIFNRLGRIGMRLMELKEPRLARLFSDLANLLKSQRTTGTNWTETDKRINDLLDETDGSISDESWTVVRSDCQRLNDLIKQRNRAPQREEESNGFFTWLSKSRRQILSGNIDSSSIPQLENKIQELNNQIEIDFREMRKLDDVVAKREAEMASIVRQGKDAEQAGNNVRSSILRREYENIQRRIEADQKRANTLDENVEKNNEIVIALEGLIAARPSSKSVINTEELVVAVENQAEASRKQKAFDRAAVDALRNSTSADASPSNTNQEFWSKISSDDDEKKNINKPTIVSTHSPKQKEEI